MLDTCTCMFQPTNRRISHPAGCKTFRRFYGNPRQAFLKVEPLLVGNLKRSQKDTLEVPGRRHHPFPFLLTTHGQSIDVNDWPAGRQRGSIASPSEALSADAGATAASQLKRGPLDPCWDTKTRRPQNPWVVAVCAAVCICMRARSRVARWRCRVLVLLAKARAG